MDLTPKFLLTGVLVSYLLLSSILYTSGLPRDYSIKKSFLGYLRRFTSHFKSEVECDVCKAVTEVAQIAFKTKPSEDDIASILTKLCIKYKLQDNRVCTGIIQVFKEEVLTVFDEFFLSPDEVCGSLFGPSCAKKPNPDIFWNVTIPKTPKPPVRPIPPPKPGSPVVRVLQISDIHHDPLYQEGAATQCGEPLCCRKNDPTPAPGKPTAGKYGDYNCDTPLITLENMLQHINNTHKIDYVIWTGDIPAHNVWSQSRSDQLHALDEAVKLMLKYLPGVTIFPALGNHESSPVNSYPPPKITGPDSNDWLRDSLATHWGHWLPNYTMSTIKKGAYYAVLVFKDFRIVSINMNYCNNMNWWLLLDDVDPANQLQWLVDTLQEAEDNKEKVHIIGHIPPGSGDCLKSWSWNYYRIVNRYQSTVTAQFFGHTHNDEWEIFYDDDTRKIPSNIAYIGPSVTPFTQRNPGYRIYIVDGDYFNSSRVVLDHETYILNLTKANQGNVKWELEYKAKEAYNMSSLLPSEWDALVHRMAEDNDLLDVVYKHFWKSSPDSVHGGPCNTTECRHEFVCRLIGGRSHDPEVCALRGLKVTKSRWHLTPLMDVC